MSAELRIGTSGWHYKHWVGNFYPEKTPASKMLEYYLRHFDTVEINNSFYQLPKPEILTTWQDATPKNFLFAVKGSRFITHNKKLKEPEHALNNLLPRVETLGRKLGPILFQLPPKWRINRDRLHDFLRALPKGHRYAFEFREPSWFDPEIYRTLEKFNAAFCIYDIGGFQSPILTTANFVYVRLHGPGNKYQGSYTQSGLQKWTRQIESWQLERKSVYVYFNNDQAGYAAKDALSLKRKVDSSSQKTAEVA